MRIYFLVQDTKGNAKASVRYIYQMEMSLKKSGYNAIILHEKFLRIHFSTFETILKYPYNHD